MVHWIPWTRFVKQKYAQLRTNHVHWPLLRFVAYLELGSRAEVFPIKNRLYQASNQDCWDSGLCYGLREQPSPFPASKTHAHAPGQTSWLSFAGFEQQVDDAVLQVVSLDERGGQEIGLEDRHLQEMVGKRQQRAQYGHSFCPWRLQWHRETTSCIRLWGLP